MPLSKHVVTWILRIASYAFWLIIVARVLSSWRREPAAALFAEPSDASETISSPRGLLLFWVSGISVYANSLLLLLWSKRPHLAGPRLLPATLPLQLAGLGLVAAGLGLLSWAYLVFRSFRMLARIEPGHELCEDGPFSLLRHPIYCAMILFSLGTLLMVPRLGLLIQVVVSALLLDARARAEEEVLIRAFGDGYRRHMARTRRFVPGLY